MPEILRGHLAAALAYAIFGLNIIFCKDLTGSADFSPITLLTFRMGGAALLFWLVSFFTPGEKVTKRDFPQIALASFVGLFVTQFAFLAAIPRSTATDTAVISTLAPVFTMLFAALFVKEPITFKKVLGVLVSFAAYLGIFRPLISRYSVVTFMKWMFLFSFLISFPFSVREIAGIEFQSVPSRTYLELGYLIVMATFVSYFLVPIAQKAIRPTLVSIYSYLQPIIAATVGVLWGIDVVSWQKIAAIILVFAGVAVVNRSRSGETEKR